MQCFEAEATRRYLFSLCRELNPALERDDLLLDDVLDAHGIDGLGALTRLEDEALSRLVRSVVADMPMAA